jgi:hypothetical protein
VYAYISQPHPRQDSVQMVGKKMLDQPQFVLGDSLPHRNAVEDDRDRTGVWHPHKGSSIPTTTNPRVWPMFPLEDFSGGAAKGTGAAWADVTFRIGLIGKLLGREIKVI